MNLKYNLEKVKLYCFSKIFFEKRRKHYQNKYAFFLQKDCIRETQKKIIKNIQKKINNNQKISVYLVAYEKLQWAFDTLYDELKKDSLFDPKVLVLNAWERKYVEKESTKDLINFFNDKNYSIIRKINRKNLPDILICPRPDFEHIGLTFCPDQVYKKCLLVYCPYIWVVENTRAEHFHYSKEIMCFFWKEYLPNKYHIKYDHLSSLQKTKLLVNSSIIILSGSLKTDMLAKAKENFQYWKQENTKKIIYAVHWSLYDNVVAFGTFHRYYDKIYEYLKINPEIEMVISPHPFLKRFIADKALQEKWGGSSFHLTINEYNDFLKKWKELPNGNIIDDADYFGLFKSSDAMILDCMSFLPEYGSLLKPMCFLSREKDWHILQSKFNPEAKELLKTIHIAYEWEDIVNFIEHVVKKDEYPQKRQREEVVKKYFSINAGHVGKFIKNDIKKSLLK